MGVDFDVNVHVRTDGKEEIDTLERQINQLNNKAIKLKIDADGDGSDFVRNFSKQIEFLNRNAVKSGQNISKSFSKGANSVKLDGFYKEYFKQIEKNEKKADQLVGKHADKSYAPTYTEALKEVKAKQSAETKATNEYIKEIEKQSDKIAQIQKKISQGSLDVESSNIKKSINKYSGIDSENLRNVENYYKKLSSLQKELKSGFDSNGKELSGNDFLSKYDSYVDVLQKAKNEIKILSNEFGGLSKPFSSLDAITASNKTLTWLKNNSAAAKDYGEQLRNLAEAQRKATSADELKNLNKQFRMITSDASRLGLTGKSFGDEFKRAFIQIGQFSQIYGGIDKFIGTVSNAVTELKEMDDILTEISKVSDLSGSQLRQLGDDAFDYANKYGKTVTDYLEGVTEMNRSGYYGQKGIDLANTSVLAQAAGDMNANVANAYLLATNAAYEYAGSAEKLNAVLDGQNMITNRNSVDMTDMAEATTQAGSMAAQAGVEVDQLSALIGTAVARTKKSGNEIGTALKALFINLQNTQNNKIVGTFDNLGISMTKMVGDSELLKTPIELIKELSDAYNTLPDGSVMKSDILTNIGGKHHANVLSSILSGYSDYEKMIKDYSEGSGSAAIEAEKSANNWTGSLNKLSNSWTEFIGNFVKSDQVIAGLKGVNGLVDTMDALVTTIGPLGAIGAGAGIFSFLKNLDKPKNHRVSA